MLVLGARGRLTQSIHFVLATGAVFFLIACGQFEAATHPDHLISGGRDISSVDDLDLWVEGNNKNPRYRVAMISDGASSQRLKTKPDNLAPSPKSGKTQVQRGESLHVIWPLNIVNNHIQVLVDGQELWINYQDTRGKILVQLMQTQSIPDLQIDDFQVMVPPRPSTPGPVISGEPMGSGETPIGLNNISMSSSAISEAHAAIQAVNLRAQEVKACQFDPLVGNNGSPNNCYNVIVISDEFSRYLSSHGYQCAQQAAQKAFGQQAGKVLFHSSGAGQVRRDRYVSGSSRKSMHATGRALDLFAVSLFFNNGVSRKVVLHKNQTDGSSVEEKQNHSFYWSYVNCWRDRIKTHSPCNCSQSLSGALTYLQNSAHHNHVHMSVPFCERSRFNVSCV